MFFKGLSFFVLLICGSGWVFAAEENPFDQIVSTIYYQENNRAISMADFQDALFEQVRNSFYHGKPPEGKEAEIKNEVWNTIREQTLLWMLADANKVQVEADEAVQKALTKYIQKFSQKTAQWESVKDSVLSVVKRRVVRETSAKKVESDFRAQVTVNQEEVHQFYLKNPKLFTEPQREEVSIILINVAPSSSSDIWEVAINQLNEIKQKIVTKDDFAKFAKEYSTDQTASLGGNMGILHDGQLGGLAKEVITNLEINKVSEPIILLEGAALFMVTNRFGMTHHSFEEVKTRAAGLALREKRKSKWEAYLTELKSNAKFEDVVELKERLVN